MLRFRPSFVPSCFWKSTIKNVLDLKDIMCWMCEYYSRWRTMLDWLLSNSAGSGLRMRHANRETFSVRTCMHNSGKQRSILRCQHIDYSVQYWECQHIDYVLLQTDDQNWLWIIWFDLIRLCACNQIERFYSFFAVWFSDAKRKLIVSSCSLSLTYDNVCMLCRTSTLFSVSMINEI